MLAERQVLDRRRVVGLRVSMLVQNLRRQLTSPATLFFAGGLGFAAGHITERQAFTQSNAEHPRASHNKLFGKALKLIALVRILSRTFPSAVMDPSVQSGSSSQAPTPRFRPVAGS
jgi:hypothetical protein